MPTSKSYDLSSIYIVDSVQERDELINLIPVMNPVTDIVVMVRPQQSSTTIDKLYHYNYNTRTWSTLAAGGGSGSGEGGGGTGGDTAVKYTINGQEAVEGNFTITAASIGAANRQHNHTIDEITDLRQELNNKAEEGHTHSFVTEVSVGDKSLHGALTLRGSDHLNLSVRGQVVTITPVPYDHDVADSLKDANSNKETKIFSGTQAEWDAFTKDPNCRYIVMIHE